MGLRRGFLLTDSLPHPHAQVVGPATGSCDRIVPFVIQVCDNVRALARTADNFMHSILLYSAMPRINLRACGAVLYQQRHPSDNQNSASTATAYMNTKAFYTQLAAL